MDFPGFWEIVALAVLALLIFGPERLPKMARDAGRMIARFKAEASATIEELKNAAELDELTSVRDDLKSTARDLKSTGRELESAGRDVRRGLDLSGERGSASSTAGVAPGATAAGSARGGATAAPAAPAPFDPDTP